MTLVDSIAYMYYEIRENYDDRSWWRARCRDRLISPFHASIYPTYDGSLRIMDADWDNLLILDGCRVDLFRNVVDLSQFDAVRTETSLGSSTPEWTRRNFAGNEFGDTVYVASNPFTSKLAGDAFHDISEVWKDSFDEIQGTVHPEPVVQTARETAERYPNKRLIVHFMQPHVPFVGHDIPGNYWDITTTMGGGSIEHTWNALERGDVDTETVCEAYADNLEYVIGPAMDLASELDGLSVVSSDHGNMLGEFAWPFPIRFYGHPRNLRCPELVNVPWAEVRDGTRREIVDEGVNSVEDPELAQVNERLEALGYA